MIKNKSAGTSACRNLVCEPWQTCGFHNHQKLRANPFPFLNSKCTCRSAQGRTPPAPRQQWGHCTQDEEMVLFTEKTVLVLPWILLSLETRYTLSKDSKYTKTIPVLEVKKQNLLYLKCAPQNGNVWERRKKMQGQKTGWTLLKQNGQIATSHSTIAQFSSPCLSPVRSENKQVFCFVYCGFASMQHTADNSASLFILAVFPLPFFSGIQLLTVFQAQCPSTQPTSLQGPHRTVGRIEETAGRNEETSTRGV